MAFYHEQPLRIKDHAYVIGEIGINHNGDMSIAKRLIDMASNCGCDAVKFQKRTLETVYTQDYLDGPRESPFGTTQRDLKERLEFGEEEYREIDAYCKSVGIDWFASAWDEESQKFLNQFDMPHNKLASALVTHPTLPAQVAREGRHTFISTGMSSYEEIDRVVEIFRAEGCPFTLMYTVSTYPTPADETNISGLFELRRRYQCDVGYSGHETGVLPSLMAMAYGAVALERHITLDRSMYGTDQPASLERRGLEMLLNYTRALPGIYGIGEKSMSASEKEVSNKLRYWA